jgi:hypothetical protein
MTQARTIRYRLLAIGRLSILKDLYGWAARSVVGQA